MKRGRGLIGIHIFPPMQIMSVQSRSDSVNTSLFDKREHIEKLHRTCNLLRKVQVLKQSCTSLSTVYLCFHISHCDPSCEFLLNGGNNERTSCSSVFPPLNNSSIFSSCMVVLTLNNKCCCDMTYTLFTFVEE